MRIALSLLALVPTVVACRSPAPEARASEEDATAAASLPVQDASVEEDAPADAPEEPEASEPEPAFSACNAPSVRFLRAYDDARTFAALAHCMPDGGGWAEGYDAGYGAMMALEQPVADHCGQPDFRRDVDIPRMVDSALPFDDATRAHVRQIFRKGRSLGRRPDVFGLVGDSITIDWSFMKPFSWTTNVLVTLDPRVKEALAIDGGRRTIIDYFRGAALPGDASQQLDPFFGQRAAKIGVRANWAITPDDAGRTPVIDLVQTISPAYAVVMYGTNDAAWYVLPPDKVAAAFGEQLEKVVVALEEHGVLPILTTIPKHMHDRRFPDCTTEATAMSNARLMIQTNAVSAEVARIACERHLPLVDYRYAIDPLLDHGVTFDGIHPTLYAKGGGILDEAGLQCGFNARNFVTLRMLKLVHDEVQRL